MIYEHLALSTNMQMMAQYLKYATRAEYLSCRIQLILFRSGLAIMICVLRQQKWLCFCKDKTYVESLPYIDINGTDIERATQAKVICVTVSSDLSWNAHVDEIVAKARKRVYMIYQLKRAGINQIDLIRIYVSVIRLVVEYACPVWHTNLPKYLSDNIEIIQKRCLKTIFSGFTCEDILQMVNIPTLHDRRSAICKPYFGRMRRGDHKLNKLLPDTRMVSYTLRSFNELPFPMANTNRHKNSLIPWCLVHCQNT